MATSGTITYNEQRNEILQDALENISAYGIGETPTPEDMEKANRVLNKMVKAWERTPNHVWKKGEATIFLRASVHKYLIGSGQDYHATESYVSTTLSADEAAAQTTLSVVSSTGMTAADYIGVVLDTGDFHWTTVSAVPDATSVTLTDQLPSIASSGNKVYAYTTKINRPLELLSARREDISQLEVPMIYLAHQEYYDLPNKTTEATPNSYNYDPQRDYGILQIWPTPADVSDIINFTYSKSIEDFTNASDDADFPVEWLEAITLNLSIRLAPSFGKAQGQRFQALMQLAQNSYQNALLGDSEFGPISVQPDLSGY